MKISTYYLMFFISLSYSQDYDFGEINDLLDDSLAVYNGNIIVLVEQNNSRIFEYQAGYIDTSSVIPIASATKWLSGAVVLSLADEGYFFLDDTIGTYLPIFTEYGKGHITIRQAFSMTSGLFNVEYYNTFSLDTSLTLEESVDSIAVHIPLAYQPGNWIAYNNNGMQTVGRIAEIVTGLDWQTIAEEQIFTPCEMFNTTYDVFGVNPVIAGGAKTSPVEYMQFLQMVMNDGIYNGDTVLTSQSIQELFTNQTAGLPIYWSPFPNGHPNYPYDAEDLRYGFGSWIFAENPTTGMVEEITSPGAFGSFPWADVSRNISGIIFTFIIEGFLPTLNTNLKLIQNVREIVDSQLHTDSNSDIENMIPESFVLLPAFPNPFNPSTIISFDLSDADMVSLDIFDIAGRQVASLINEYMIPGSHQINWNPGQLSSGIYFVKLIAGNTSLNQKITYVK
tara:strand:+ start:85 stop:1434 length:1350 start_codon:yes stop_codon:yes gene_type:complete